MCSLQSKQQKHCFTKALMFLLPVIKKRMLLEFFKFFMPRYVYLSIYYDNKVKN